jgi:hypothetical protein
MPVPPPAGSCGSTVPCNGNGACNVTSQTCSCGPGWAGAHCDQPQCSYNCSGYVYNATPFARGQCVAPAAGSGGEPACVCNTPYYGPACGSTAQTIAYTVNHTSALSSLWSVLQLPAAASFLQMLSSTTGNYTLFAPTNAAFANVPTNVATFLTSTAGATALQDVLQYHVVENLGPAMVLTQSSEATQLSGASLTLVDTPATVFQMVNSTPNGACSLTTFNSGGNVLQCFTEGQGRYGNNETCAIQVLAPVTLNTPDGFQTEAGYDILTVNGRAYSGTTGPAGQYVPAGSMITWVSDYSVTYVTTSEYLSQSHELTFAALQHPLCTAFFFQR